MAKIVGPENQSWVTVPHADEEVNEQTENAFLIDADNLQEAIDAYSKKFGVNILPSNECRDSSGHMLFKYSNSKKKHRQKLVSISVFPAPLDIGKAALPASIQLSKDSLVNINLVGYQISQPDGSSKNRKRNWLYKLLCWRH